MSVCEGCPSLDDCAAGNFEAVGFEGCLGADTNCFPEGERERPIRCLTCANLEFCEGGSNPNCIGYERR